MKLFLCLSVILCSSPLSSPIFKKKDNKFLAELPFTRKLNVKSYEIMVGTLDAGERDYITLDKKKDQQGFLDSIIVKLDIIKKNDDKHQFSICVEELEKIVIKRWYSESFRFDVRNKEWVLSRAYEEDAFFIKYLKYIVGIFAIIGVGLIGFIVSKYVKKKSNENSL